MLDNNKHEIKIAETEALARDRMDEKNECRM